MANADQNVLSFIRFDIAGNQIVVIANFSGTPHHNFRIGVPKPGTWVETLNTDAKEFGGSGVGNGGAVDSQSIPSHGHGQSLELTLPPFGLLWLKPH